jgi:transcription elongation factor GreB
MIMSKAFTKETDESIEEAEEAFSPIAAGETAYITPSGFDALQRELRQLLYTERPQIVEIVAWAAGNGDRSENGDYIYGKRRLREIDKRVRYLTKRLEGATVVNPAEQQQLRQVFFGATVCYAKADDSEHTVQLVGADEADASIGKINWQSPLARALFKAGVGDSVVLRTPSGEEVIEVLSIRYVVSHTAE